MTSRHPRVLAPVLTPDDLPLAELCGARLDGEVYPLGDFWCPIDEPDGPLGRARTAGLLVPPRAIAERMTAAWIYGLCPEPARHQFCVDLAARTHVPPSPRLQLREVRCAPEETSTIAGLPVTMPLRTVVDLARSPELDAPSLPPLLAALLLLGGFRDAHVAVRICQRQNLPHKTIALARLAAAQEIMPPVR
ncbi:MAG: hypothetical protein ABIX44_08755 [Cryobacterium sp.]